MMRALVFCCLVAVALAAKDTCEHKGKLHKKGDSFKDDCNRCFCAGDNLVSCTKMMCIHDDAKKDICEHKGKVYKKGDSFKDDCNRCFCAGNNLVGCTKMMCIHDLEAKNDICEHKGKVYKKGDSFKDDCNRCFCAGNNLVGCTKMMCIHDQEAKDTCEHKGKLYKKGDSFKDDCNRCFCAGNGRVGCTKMMCRPHHGGLEMLSAKDTCEHKGKLYKKGDSFKDDCNRCFCAGNGRVGCTKMMCRPHHGGLEMLSAEKDTCDYKGQTYLKGDSFKDDCNRCFCAGNNMVGCTAKMCIHKQEAEKDTCEHKGQLYKKGDRFKDDCNTCFCAGNNMVGCTRMMCRPRHGGKVMFAEPETDTCSFNGKLYKRGDSFKNDCNTCICGGNNAVGCTLMMCPAEQQVSYADNETCTHNGKVYKKGDNFSIDGCNRCFCGGNNQIGCTKRLCPPKGCRHNGKFLAVGEHFKKECNRCICSNRGAICTKMACRHHKPGH